MSSILTILSGAQTGRAFDPPAARITIGRDASATLRLEDDRASRLHAAIETRPQGVFVLDLNSSNGLFVNDRLVTEHLLQEGDVITIGHTRILYGAEPAARLAPPPPAQVESSDQTVILAPPPAFPPAPQRTILDQPPDDAGQRTVIQP